MKDDFNPIFFDMDGVMCDTDRYIEMLTGVSPKQMSGNQKWKIMGQPGFFQKQPVMEGIHEILDIAFASGRPVCILSSTGDKENASRIGKEKAFWLNWWLEKYKFHSTIFVRGSAHKEIYSAPGRVLMDDMSKNIDPWNLAGGIGILFKNVQQAHAELKTVLSK